MGMALLVSREITDAETSNATVSVQELISAARKIFIDSDQLAEQFERYLNELAAHKSAGPTDPLAPVNDDSDRLRTP